MTEPDPDEPYARVEVTANSDPEIRAQPPGHWIELRIGVFSFCVSNHCDGRFITAHPERVYFFAEVLRTALHEAGARVHNSFGTPPPERKYRGGPIAEVALLENSEVGGTPPQMVELTIGPWSFCVGHRWDGRYISVQPDAVHIFPGLVRQALREAGARVVDPFDPPPRLSTKRGGVGWLKRLLPKRRVR